MSTRGEARKQAEKTYQEAVAQAEEDHLKAIKHIRITGLEGKVNLEDLYEGIYLIMGKPECVRVYYATKDDKDEHDLTAFQQVHFWEDQPTTAFQASFIDVPAEEVKVILATAWHERDREARAQGWEAFDKAKAQAGKVRDEAMAQAEKLPE